MTEQKKPAPFQHVDGGLTEELKSNLVDPGRPMMERMAAGIMLMGARAVLDRMNADSVAMPDTLPAPKPLVTALPPPPTFTEGSEQ